MDGRPTDQATPTLRAPPPEERLTRPPGARPDWLPDPARRRRAWRALRVMVWVALTPVIFALVAAVSLVGREITAPTWLRLAVEDRAEAVLGGGSLRFDAIYLTVGADLHPRVRLSGAELRDADGHLILRVPGITGTASPRGLLFRREVLVQEIVVEGAELRLDRARDGSMALRLGDVAALGPAPADATAPSAPGAGFVDLLARLEEALSAPAFEALEHVRATGTIVNYSDARAGRSWTVDNGEIGIDLTGGRTRMTAELALLSGRASVTRLSGRYDSADGSRAAQLDVTLADAEARDIASQAAVLAWLGALDAPISGTFSGEVTETGDLGPLEARLEIGAGALRPTAEVDPLPFRRALIDLRFSPETGILTLDRLEAQGAGARLSGSGAAVLVGLETGMLEALEGSLTLQTAEYDSGLYTAPVALDAADIQWRVQLSPFSLEVADVALVRGPTRITGRGGLFATPEGWRLGADLRVPEIAVAEALALWPETVKPNTRRWFVNNLTEGRARNVALALRVDPTEAPDIAASFEIEEAAVRFLRRMPPAVGVAGQGSLSAGRLTLTAEAGTVTAPSGGTLAIAGTVFDIPDVGLKPAPAAVEIVARGPLPAALSLLNQPPFEYLSKANLPESLATGRARIAARVVFPLKPRVEPDEVGFAATAVLTGVASDVLVPGKALRARELTLNADRAALVVEGTATVDGVRAEGIFRLPFGPRETRGAPTLEARVALSPEGLEALGIRLPPGSIAGQGEGQLSMTLPRGAPPTYLVTSDLRGLTVSVPAVSWSKPPSAAGALEVAGQLGANPTVERLALSAPGLDLSGQLRLGEGGAFQAAEFDRLRVGGWLDAALTLTSRGAGRPPAVTVSGGSLDLGRAEFASGGRGAPPPIEARLDLVRITDAIQLAEVSAALGPEAGGLGGSFQGRIAGSGAFIQGSLVPTDTGTAVRVLSQDAGGVLAGAGLLRTAQGGALELVLVPTGQPGTWDGQATITDIRVRDVPAVAALVDAISVVGLLQQLDGQGLAFSDVNATFRIQPGMVTIAKASAVGASLGLSLDGYYRTDLKQMDVQGVISPAYFINAIGAPLTREGEGLVGLSFRLRGGPDAPIVDVNPLSALAPGFLREAFRRPPPILDN